jgi:hypothetical protein
MLGVSVGVRVLTYYSYCDRILLMVMLKYWYCKEQTTEKVAEELWIC